jgi:hypothetical protein
MKRSTFLLILSFGLVFCAKGNHITGGQIYYTLTNQSGNNYTYSVSLLLYRDSLSTGANDQTASIAIFDRLTDMYGIQYKYLDCHSSNSWI